MEIDRIHDGLQFNHDLPHENTMDRLGIELEDLNASLKSKIRIIDDLFVKAMKDGYVDDKEEEELITKSYWISEEIERLYSEQSNDGLNIVAGLLLLLGTAIGLKQIIK